MENWANRKTLILGRSEMIGLLKPHEYNDCVEQAYRMHGEGRYYMDPKGHIVLDRFPGEWEAMPSYIEEPHAAACKWVSIREQNREKFNLPTVFSILIYTHPETGFPLAIVDGSYHTVMRTGAAAAVSAKWMARKDSQKLAIVGAGHMAEGALATCNEVFPWSEVRVWSRSQATLDHFVKEQQPKYESFEIKPSTEPRADRARRRRGGDADAGARADRHGRLDRARHAHRRGRRRQEGRSGARRQAAHARPHLRRRHPPVPHRRRDQRAAVGGADHRGRHRRRDRRGDHRQEEGPHLGRGDHASSIRPASRCRIRRPCRSNTSARWPPASASRRR